VVHAGSSGIAGSCQSLVAVVVVWSARYVGVVVGVAAAARVVVMCLLVVTHPSVCVCVCVYVVWGVHLLCV